MIIDDKGRLFGKISIIDLFVTVVIVLVIAVVFLQFGSQSHAGISNTQQLVRITFYKDAVEDFVAESIFVGDLVVNETNNTEMGTIVAVTAGESINYFPDVNGNEVASPMQGYSSITITSEVMGYLSEDAVLLNGNLYGKGTEIIIRAGKAKIFLNISNIEVVQ